MLTAAPRVSRRLRNPQHPFNVDHAPFVIQPFFIAPVLPGESLVNLSFQSRVLTKPIKNPLIGWWIEHYFFYVKHRDMADSAIFQGMMLDYANSIASAADYVSAANPGTYYGWRSQGTGMNWVKSALKAVIEAHFRDEGRAWNSCLIDSNPAAYVNSNSWADSLVLESEVDTEVDVKIPVNATPAPDEVSYLDIKRAEAQYQLLVAGGLVNATYEDFLRSYGVRIQMEDMQKPELIRYSRSWSYPSSHVQPNATTPALSDVTAAVSWSVAERANKRRLFKEPGFILGVTCCRPKVYRDAQYNPATAMMTDALAWLPAILADNTEASWRKVADHADDMFSGNLPGDWRFDIKDLFLYGDQFITGGAAASGKNLMAIPDGDGMVDSREPAQAGVDELFVSGDATDGVMQDGLVRLNIMSTLADTSPRGAVLAGGSF